MRLAARLDAMGLKKYRGLTRKKRQASGLDCRIRLAHDELGIPGSWKKPRRIFVNSMSDRFRKPYPQSLLSLSGMQAGKPQHTLSDFDKRPDRMREITHACGAVLPKVWLGTKRRKSGDYLGRI